MNPEDIPFRCQSCPFILPLIETFYEIENQQITPEVRMDLIDNEGLLPEDVDRISAENERSLELARQTLSNIFVRTIGCTGTRPIVLDPSTQSTEGMELICQSPEIEIHPKNHLDT